MLKIQTRGVANLVLELRSILCSRYSVECLLNTLMTQLVFFQDALSPRHAPTNLTADRHPIHRWFNFIAGFSPEFVSCCIHNSGIKSAGGRLLDPFAGLSTSLVQANQEEISSVGFEPHPFFFDISRAKIFPPVNQDVVDAIEQLTSALLPYNGELVEVWNADARRFLMKLVPEQDLRFLASAVLAEQYIETSNRPLFRLIVSRVLELAAGSSTDGIYKAPTTLKRSTPYLTGISDVCREIRTDIGPSHSQAILYGHSSESMPDVNNESCSICVTSPPYLNNFDFAEMTRMELYFWRYASSWGEITERVRRRLIVNTTTAPTDLKRAHEAFASELSPALRSTLKPLVDALRDQHKIRAGKKDYWMLIYPYFSQMRRVFREVLRVLRPMSAVHIVIGDAALYGVHIRMDILMSQLLRDIGFEIRQIETLRTRGDRWILAKRQGSRDPLGEFHIHARRP